MKRILFATFSHQLTEAQKEGFDQVFTLKEVAPELAAQCEQVPTDWTAANIRPLAKEVVDKATSLGATHFACQGEATLQFWANLLAANLCQLESTGIGFTSCVIQQGCNTSNTPMTDFSNGMTCIVAITKRDSIDELQLDGSIKKTVKFAFEGWREIF